MEKRELIFSYFDDLKEVKKEQYACLKDLKQKSKEKIYIIYMMTIFNKIKAVNSV